MKTLDINSSKPYKITVGSGIIKDAGRLISEVLPPCRICVVIDETVQRLYGGEQSSLHECLENAGFDVCWFAFPPGEKSKSLETIGSILDFLAGHSFDRSDAIVALGGGVPGDMAGFAASIYMRGIKFVQMPTTLLACVDSSIGGKTGVDLAAGKNLAGTFWQPEMVIADTDFFGTLTEDLWRDGLAEMIKAGVIADPSILTKLSASELTELPAGEEPASGSVFEAGTAGFRSAGEELTDLIARALKVKADIVAADELEKNIRRLLNFGHTIGHAIEKCSGYTISHGHAVAVGMVMESAAAESRGWASKGNADLLKSLLGKLGFPMGELADTIRAIGAASLAKAAMGDKKAHGDSITIAYPMRPGLCRLKDLPKAEMEDFIGSGLKSL